jgi:hypothetical protein
MKSPRDCDAFIPYLLAKIVGGKNKLCGASDGAEQGQLLGLKDFEIAEPSRHSWRALAQEML